MDNTVHSISAKVGGTPQSDNRLGPAARTSRASCASESVLKDEAREPQLTVLENSQGLSAKAQEDALENLAFDEFFLRGDDPPSGNPSAQKDVELERESDWQLARTPIQLARRSRYIKLVRAIVATLAVGSTIAIAVSLATKPEPKALFELPPGPEYSGVAVALTPAQMHNASVTTADASKSDATSASPSVVNASKPDAMSAPPSVVNASKSDATSASPSVARTSKATAPRVSNHASTTASRPTARASNPRMLDLKKGTTTASGAVTKANRSSTVVNASTTKSRAKPAGYRPPTATFWD